MRRTCSAIAVDGGVDLVGVELRVDDEEPRVERRVGAGVDAVHELRAVLHLAVEARAVAAAEHHAEQVEVRRVGVLEVGDLPGDTEQRLLELARHDRRARRGLRGLGRARVREVRRAASRSRTTS